jgi:hypothetical protein
MASSSPPLFGKQHPDRHGRLGRIPVVPGGNCLPNKGGLEEAMAALEQQAAAGDEDLSQGRR